MRREDVQYWDEHFSRPENGSIRDNVKKRQEILRRLLDLPLIGKTVLEIGCGFGTTFAAVRVILMDAINYLAIDVSKKSVEFVKNQWGAKSVQADITRIPLGDGKVDIVVALDVLEHVRPEDRERGYLEINRVLSPGGLVALNIPRTESKHDAEFDYGFSDVALLGLATQTSTHLLCHDRYNVPLNGENRPREYIWAVLQKS